MENSEIPVISEKNLRMEKAMKDLSETFDGNEINYFVIGSLARNIYMGNELQTPEIDLLIPNKSQQAKATELIKIVKGNNGEIDIDSSLSELVEEEDGIYHLVYGNLKSITDPNIFEAEKLQIGNTKFRTLKPSTLLHTYTFVGGPFRKKDWTNALIFARWMKQKGVVYNDSDYDAFHNFGKERWKKSPLRKIQYAWRKTINSLPDDARNKIVDLYDTSLITSAREIFNRLERATCKLDSD